MLESLDRFKDKTKQPSESEMIRYLFWTMGIGKEEFDRTSLPYIFSILKTHNYVKQEEEKAYKKAKKK